MWGAFSYDWSLVTISCISNCTTDEKCWLLANLRFGLNRLKGNVTSAVFLKFFDSAQQGVYNICIEVRSICPVLIVKLLKRYKRFLPCAIFFYISGSYVTYYVTCSTVAAMHPLRGPCFVFPGHIFTVLGKPQKTGADQGIQYVRAIWAIHWLRR